jgi:hypothetical protein
MEQLRWSELPYELLECIASFADIDSRRALGFKPRNLKHPMNDLWKVLAENGYAKPTATLGHIWAVTPRLCVGN